MTVGLEVDADVKFGGCVVEPFYTCRGADNWESERFLDIFG